MCIYYSARGHSKKELMCFRSRIVESYLEITCLGVWAITLRLDAERWLTDPKSARSKHALELDRNFALQLLWVVDCLHQEEREPAARSPFFLTTFHPVPSSATLVRNNTPNPTLHVCFHHIRIPLSYTSSIFCLSIPGLFRCDL